MFAKFFTAALALVAFGTVYAAPAPQADYSLVGTSCTTGDFICDNDVVYQCDHGAYILNQDCKIDGRVCLEYVNGVPDFECVLPDSPFLAPSPSECPVPTETVTETSTETTTATETETTTTTHVMCETSTYYETETCTETETYTATETCTETETETMTETPVSSAPTPTHECDDCHHHHDHYEPTPTESPVGAAPTPVGECELGHVHCSGDVVEQCAYDSDLTLHYVALTDCSLQNLVCGFNDAIDIECMTSDQRDMYVSMYGSGN